jgi:hypothetical protein
MEKKLIGALAGLVFGWIVEQVAAEVLEAVGVPKHAAKAAGAVIGSALA